MKQKLSIVLTLSMILMLLAGCAKSANPLGGLDNEQTAAEMVTEEAKEATQKVEYVDKYIDLHLHLDGAVTVDIAKQLAQLQGIDLPTEDDAELEAMLQVSPSCTSLNEFLEKFALPVSLMQTPEGLSEAVRLVAENIRSQGVIYAEFRFAPQKHTDGGMTQEDAVLAALEGLKRTDLKVN